MWTWLVVFLIEEIMENPTEHANKMRKEIENLSEPQRAKFIAWCIFYFTKDVDAMNFISNHVDKRITKIARNLPYELWDSKLDKFQIKTLLDIINRTDWRHEDVADKDEDASQGALDLLASIQAGLQGLLDNSAADITDCAMNVSNRIDYLINFFGNPESDLEKEYTKQNNFISLLKSNSATLDWGR